eukprot:3008332-Rhodomonas_salina.1
MARPGSTSLTYSTLHAAHPACKPPRAFRVRGARREGRESGRSGSHGGEKRGQGQCGQGRGRQGKSNEREGAVAESQRP